jgi:hypothetical protein
MLSNSKLYQTNLNVRAGIYFTKQPEFCFADRLDGVGVSVGGQRTSGRGIAGGDVVEKPL